MQLLWSPFRDDEFILYGNSILFYRISSFDSTLNRNRIDSNFLSDNSYAKLIGSISNYKNQKLLSWYPGFEISNFYTIALHENNQNQIRLLSLTSFNASESLADNELTILLMEHPRVGHELKWNPVKCNYLGLACEEFEDSSSIYIWDAFRSTSSKPVYELNETSSCYSICWHPENPEILFAGVANQYISLYDLRTGVNTVESVNTQFIHGFTLDSKNSYRAISYDDNMIAIWDLRKFNKPVGVMNETKPIKKVQFCPSRADRLGVLTEGSNRVNVYRIEERNGNFFKETVQYQRNSKSSAAVSSFSWHSKDYNRMMVSFNNFVLKDLIIADHCPIGFSINDKLNVGMNDKVLVLDMLQNDSDIDIGEKMKMRALNSYGVVDFQTNESLISNDRNETDLKYLWQWFNLSKVIYENKTPYLRWKDDKIRYGSEPKSMEKYIGIKTILTTQTTILHSNNNTDLHMIHQTIIDINKKYVFQICEWENWKQLVEKLESQKEYERAACISVFNKDLKKAIEILTNASKESKLSEYLALSLTLSFLSKSGTLTPENKDSTRVLSKLTNPYLKALFQYQIDPYNFDYQIYNDSQILIPDRVCMAWHIFKKDQLLPYIAKLTSDCIKQGNLYGILLTGLNVEAIELFQFYIKRTSDIQTPAVAIIHSKFDLSIPSKYVSDWIMSYRELLDSWMLWDQRAQYDINRTALGSTKHVEPKVHIRCKFCPENISSSSKSGKHPESVGANIGMTCQSCKKPLLRCAVCSLYMNKDPPRSVLSGAPDKTIYWFVFCQKCGHGGHLGHLRDWFKTNPECPVMDCKCQCCISEGFYDE